MRVKIGENHQEAITKKKKKKRHLNSLKRDIEFCHAEKINCL